MIAHDEMPEHEFEAERGLPEPLPTNERLLWQGAPQWRSLARSAMHINGLSIYFAVLLCWRAANVLSAGGRIQDAVMAVLYLLPLAILAIGLLALIAWLTARTSVYTVTDRRVVLRVGVVLSITFNLPYSQIDSAGVRMHGDGSGDITLALNPSANIAYLHLWPHARPMRIKRTEPMLRAVPDAARVAQALASALAASAGTIPVPVPVSAVAPEARTSGAESLRNEPMAA